METATFGGGCFWCTEAVFKRLRGVKEVVSGYSGGNRPAGGKKPSYEQVSTGITGHAEAVQITFDPSVISFSKLLDVFFATHDPTTMNQQGAAGHSTVLSSFITLPDNTKKQSQRLKNLKRNKYLLIK